MRNISILGSTGSIGTQTIDVIEKNNDINVVAMSCGKNIQLFEKQVRKLHPKLAVVMDEKLALTFRDNISDIDGVEVMSGMDGLIAVSTHPDSELLVTAIVGMIGIRPTIAAIKAKKDIALANKETLVCAGHIIMPHAKEMGVSILPVDSEHSAIFQCLNGEHGNEIYKIHLTASGGPFRGKTRAELSEMKAKDALKHPNWDMGAKVTIDSSTLVNKGLEVMEASWLFGVDADKINVVVHPQSIVHSMVEYNDGSVIAKLGAPDMRLPIQYALYYPNRRPAPGERVDFFDIAKLTFEKPDTDTFKGLKLAFSALKRGGNIPTAFNASNEIAVKRFLNDKIKYLEIPECIEKAMDEIEFIDNPNVDDILDTERRVGELLL